MGACGPGGRRRPPSLPTWRSEAPSPDEYNRRKRGFRAGTGNPAYRGVPPRIEARRATTDKEEKTGGAGEWRRRYEATPERQGELFATISGVENEPLYSADDVDLDYDRDLGWPGAYPFTRGVYPSMYRGRLWTMRQFAGFGTAEETNARYKYLLDHGQTGLSVAFDFPTLMGYDSDHPRSLGEVGKCGVAISSLADMETLFDGIPLDQVSVSMTINGPAIILFCFNVIAAEKQGVKADQLRGTVQNDILKEFMAQHAWVFPPEPAISLIID